MQSPFFSVIIPTYNRKEFLKKAINSVLEKTEKDWELLIVDDGSSDGSQPLKEEIPPSRLEPAAVSSKKNLSFGAPCEAEVILADKIKNFFSFH